MHLITITYGILTFSFFLFCTNSGTTKKRQDDKVTNLASSKPETTFQRKQKNISSNISVVHVFLYFDSSTFWKTLTLGFNLNY